MKNRTQVSDSDFTLWLADVDALLVAEICLDSACLPDYLWREEFESGTSPEDAIAAYLEHVCYQVED